MQHKLVGMGNDGSHWMQCCNKVSQLRNTHVVNNRLSFVLNKFWFDHFILLHSVRVSNELGAAHPRTAKFSVLVVVISSFVIGLLISLVLIIFRQQYPSLFSDSTAVKRVVYELTPLLAFCIVINNIQPALSGNCEYLYLYLLLCNNCAIWDL